MSKTDTPTGAKPSGLDRLRSRPPATDVYEIAMNPSDAIRLQALHKTALDSKANALAFQGSDHVRAEVEALATEAIADYETFLSQMDVITFHITAIDKPLYEAMVVAAQPDQETQESFKDFTGDPGAQLTVNRDVFLVLAIEACVTRIEFTDGTPPITELDSEVIKTLTDGKTINATDLSNLCDKIILTNQLETSVHRLGKS